MYLSGFLFMLVALLAAALLSAMITWAIRPMLLRHALARPNARSSHRIPTPQGAGIAVIAATLLVAAMIVAFAPADHLQIPVFGACSHAVHRGCRLRRRREINRSIAAAGVAGGGRRHHHFRRFRRPPDGRRLPAYGSSERCCSSRGFGSSISSTSWTGSTG